MNRRNFIQTVAASPLINTLGTVSAKSDDDDPDYPPTYYTVLMPSINVQLIHISIPDDLLAASRTITVHTETERRVLTITDDRPDDDRGNWTMRNYTVDEADPIESVSVGGVESRQWDVLEVQRAAMYFESEKFADKGYVAIHCDDRPVTIETPEGEYVCEVESYTQQQVPTDDPSQVDVWTIRDGQRVSIPLYPVSQVSVARWNQ